VRRLTACHPERSRTIREADRFAESKDPYIPRTIWIAKGALGANVDLTSTASGQLSVPFPVDLFVRTPYGGPAVLVE
jgi:hypothetical protein